MSRTAGSLHKKLQTQWYKEKVVAVRVLSGDWGIRTHRLTGQPIGKHLSVVAVVAAKHECRILDVNVSRYRKVYDFKTVPTSGGFFPCSNAKR